MSDKAALKDVKLETPILHMPYAQNRQCVSKISLKMQMDRFCEIESARIHCNVRVNERITNVCALCKSSRCTCRWIVFVSDQTKLFEQHANDLFIRLDCVIVIFRRLSDTDAAKSMKKLLQSRFAPVFCAKTIQNRNVFR